MKRIRLSIKKKLAGIALLSVELIIVLILFIAALIIFSILVYRVFKLQSHEFDFLMIVTFYGLLIVLVWENTADRLWKWIVTILLLLLISLIGFSRVYLRLHYFSDVIAGFAAGMIWLTLSIWTIGRIERFSRREID